MPHLMNTLLSAKMYAMIVLILSIIVSRAYKRTLFMNGDMGYIRYIKETDTGIVMAVEFDTGMARIYGPYMSNLLLGYAISIHKSQGSEAKAVIVITSPMHKCMLSSNLLYVADSRAKEQLIEIGDVKTIKEGLKRHEQKERDTWLKELLLNK